MLEVIENKQVVTLLRSIDEDGFAYQVLSYRVCFRYIIMKIEA